MPPSKAKVIEQLSSVKNLGESYATAAYEDLGVRTLDDLIEAAKAGKLQSIKGIGAAKEKAILKSAQEMAGGEAPAPEAKPKKEAKKPKKEASKPKKEAPKAKKDEPKPKKEAPKKEAKKEEPKKEEPKAEKPKPAASKPAQERPRTTYRPPQPKPRPSIPGLIFKLTKKIIGRILS